MEFEHLDLRELLEHAHIGVVIHRWDTSIVYANPTALRLLRLTYDQIIGKDAFDPGWHFLDEYGNRLALEDYPVNKVIRSDGRLENEIIGVIDSSKTEISWFLLNAYAEGVSEETGKFIVVTFNDITESKHLFSFQDIVERTQDLVVVTDAKNIDGPTGPRIIYVNRAFERLTGYSKEEAIGETPRMLQGALTDQEATQRIHKALEKKQAVSETVLNYDKKGRPYWIEMNIIPLTNIDGEVSHFAAIERDVSERKFHLEQLEQRNKDLKALKTNLEKRVEERTVELREANAKLQKLAFFDPLTQLPNRRYFIDQTHKLMKSSNRHRELVAFGVLDVDFFKRVNDTYGHDVGDLVLVGLGAYFRGFFRMDDAFCRFGGEEFAFAVSVPAIEKVEILAERFIAGIRELRIDIGDDSSLSVTASLGIKVCIPSEDTDFEEQMKLADQGLYQAKQSGRDQYVILPPCSD
jgi:diguanylate cyclase (GGDEF)-like protein/PAS domain S-box-containing protein